LAHGYGSVSIILGWNGDGHVEETLFLTIWRTKNGINSGNNPRTGLTFCLVH
jgi:hypothetical protein